MGVAEKDVVNIDRFAQVNSLECTGDNKGTGKQKSIQKNRNNQTK